MNSSVKAASKNTKALRFFLRFFCLLPILALQILNVHLFLKMDAKSIVRYYQSRIFKIFLRIAQASVIAICEEKGSLYVSLVDYIPDIVTIIYMKTPHV